MNKNLELFLTFMKIGAFTFGGGYAMIPLIHKEVCENKKWLNEKEISDIVAISESTPGPIAINAFRINTGPDRDQCRNICRI